MVGQKIVATLNSTGTPALFMHAADAIHGDLGMVAKDDIVMCLSKSGETPEIKVLVPLVKQLGNKLIANVELLGHEAGGDVVKGGHVRQRAPLHGGVAHISNDRLDTQGCDRFSRSSVTDQGANWNTAPDKMCDDRATCSSVCATN